ncbi:MAG: SprT family zinc-dependent metalloprotease [Pseudomonadota bacterium]
MPGRIAPIRLQDPDCTIDVSVNSRAKRFTLRLRASGAPALTVPRGVSRSDAEDFIQRHRGWLRQALGKRPEVTEVTNGAVVPIDGKMYRVTVVDGRRMAPCVDGDCLLLSGDGAVGPRVAAWLKLRARDRLQPAARSYARKLSKRINSISLRDTTSRWGSCSSARNLSFSWRLAMAPVEIQDYVAAHEAAHLVEMNHSPRYWSVLEGLMPDYARHRAWLKREGRALHAYRFEGTS